MTSRHPYFKDKRLYYFVVAIVLLGGLAILFDDAGRSFGGGGDITVARVGGATVTSREFGEKRREILARFQGVSAQELRARGFDVDLQAVSELTNGLAVETYASETGMRAPERAALDQIAAHPFFSDRATGKFSPKIYRNFLRSQGMTQDAFIQEVKNGVLRETLAGAVTPEVFPPRILSEPVYRYVREKRAAEIATIREEHLPNFAFDPSEADLRKYYADNKETFRMREKRDFNYLLLSPETVRDRINVTEAHVKAEYAAQKATEYTTPEKREVYQIIFENEAQAKKTRPLLKDGSYFFSSLEEAGFKISETALGYVTRDDLYGDAAETVFLLPKGKVSDVSQSDFGYAVYFVNDINPGRVLPLEEVSEKIREKLVTLGGEKYVYDALEKLEEARAGGADIKTLAEEFGGKFAQVKNTPSFGDKQTVSLPTEMLEGVFLYRPGEEAPMLETKDGYYFYEIAAVSPSAVPEYEAVVSDVKKKMRRAELSKALAVFSQNLEKNFSDYNDFKKSLSSIGAAPRSEILSRGQSGAQAPLTLTEAIFDMTPDGGFVRQEFFNDSTPFVKIAYLKEIIAPKAPEENERNFAVSETMLKQTLSAELFQQFIDAAKVAVGAEVDIGALNKLKARYDN